MPPNLIAYSIPAFFLLIGVELVASWRTGARVYRVQDAVNSLACGISQQVTGVFAIGWTVGGYVFLYEHLRVTTLDAGSVAVWVFGALAVDLLYYWFHRASHRVGLLWAAHVVHHQSEDYNLTTALRQSALQGLFSAVFYWPLALLGLPPFVFVLLSASNTVYQFWIHTRLVGRLGPLEWVLNTPSHHRVHHGIDPQYIDKNYAGVLIVWDRIFGTFAPEREEPAFGTVEPLASWNPLWANLDTWVKIARRAHGARRLRDKAWALFAPPEWRPPERGGPVHIPEVDHARRVRYEQPRRGALDVYILAHLSLSGLAFLPVIVLEATAPFAQTLALTLFTLAALLAFGGLHEGKRWAPPLEWARLMSAPGLALWLVGWGAAEVALLVAAPSALALLFVTRASKRSGR